MITDEDRKDAEEWVELKIKEASKPDGQPIDVLWDDADWPMGADPVNAFLAGIERERKKKLRAAWDSTGNGPIKAIVYDEHLSTNPAPIDNPAPADCQPFEQLGPRYWRIKG